MLASLGGVNLATKAGLSNFIAVRSKITAQGAFNSGIQLSKLNKEFPDELTDAISNLISITNLQLNLIRPMNDIQIAMATADLISDWWRIRLDEMIYIFREGVKGKFGKIYDRFDYSIICDWIKSYDEGEREHLLAGFVSQTKVTTPQEPEINIPTEILKQLSDKFQSEKED